MKRIFLPTQGPADWQRHLAEPDKHWRTGFSAKTLAHGWESTPAALPTEILSVLDACGDAALKSLELLFAVPEYQVPLDGGGRPSQSDLFALCRNHLGLVAMTVEGKVAEPFGPTLGEWLVDASPLKRTRLDGLRRRLGLRDPVPEAIRYQLLHRAASAMIEAERFHARTALMVVHSYSPERQWYDDYAAFVRMFEPRFGDVGFEPVSRLTSTDGITLFAAWARGDERYLLA